MIFEDTPTDGLDFRSASCDEGVERIAGRESTMHQLRIGRSGP